MASSASASEQQTHLLSTNQRFLLLNLQVNHHHLKVFTQPSSGSEGCDDCCGAFNDDDNDVHVKNHHLERPSPSHPGPEGYPRVLDYSIFKALPAPYPKNFTTRADSRVVMIFIFVVQSFKYSESGKVKLLWWTHISHPAKKCRNYSNVYLSVLWHSWAPLNV